MTYAEYIDHHNGTPEDLISCIEIRHNTVNNWYQARGKWHGRNIIAHAPNFKTLREKLCVYCGIQIPIKKALLFSHTSDGFRFALLQGYLPGSAVVDLSAYKPTKQKRS